MSTIARRTPLVFAAFLLMFASCEAPEGNGQDGPADIYAVTGANLAETVAASGMTLAGIPSFSDPDDRSDEPFWLVPILEGDRDVLYGFSAIDGRPLFSEAGVGGPEQEPRLLALTTYPSVRLSVYFFPQVPPGDWSNTKNCGQTSVLMAAGYLSGVCFLNPADQITKENAWLAKTYNDSTCLAANGCYTTTSKLSKLATDYWGRSASYGSSGTRDLLYNSLKANKPVVVAVRTGMGTTTGVKHFMLLVGMDANNVYVNDPGKTLGSNKSYPWATFDASWATQGRAYVRFN